MMRARTRETQTPEAKVKASTGMAVSRRSAILMNLINKEFLHFTALVAADLRKAPYFTAAPFPDQLEPSYVGCYMLMEFQPEYETFGL